MRLALLILLLLIALPARAEPVTTAVALVAAWAGVTATTVYLVAATVILSTGMAVYGTAQAKRAERSMRNQQATGMQDRMATRIASESPHRYIYGRAKVGADIVAMFTSGERDEFRHLVCVFAAHECDAIEEIYVNNSPLGVLDGDGDVTTGRYATSPMVEVTEEYHLGPTITLDRYPKQGSIWVFSGAAPNMVRVIPTSISGRTVTIDGAYEVMVSYEYSRPRKFGAEEFFDYLRQDKQIKNPAVRVHLHLGTPTDPADAYLMSVVPGKWTSTAVLRGMCYAVITLDLNTPEFQGGSVPIHARIRGRKLYDPRTGLKTWSRNPALAIMDYLTSPLCGVPMADLPTSQFIAAANVCDDAAVVVGGRYTINGTVTSEQSQSVVLEHMTQAMAGGLVSTTWDVYAGKYIAPVATLNQADIVGGLSITPGVSDASVYNGVKGQYISDENGQVMTDFKPYQNPTYRTSDGRDLYTNIDFPFTDSLQRIHNLARIFTEDQRNGFTLKAEFSLKAWPLKVGQRISFTSEFLGQTAKVYRITDKNYSPNSAVELTLKEDDESIWDFADAVVVDSTPNTDLPDPWAIAPLGSISCTSGEATLLRQPDGSTVPRILASWPAATTQTVFLNGHIEVEWRAVATAAWNRTTVSGSDTQAYLSPITPGFFYTVRARTVNPNLNVSSEWVTTTYQVVVFAARPVAYKWAATQPDQPSGAGSYLWGTASYAAPSEWSLTQPAAPAGGGVSLWEAGVLVTDISAAGSTAFDWAKADVFSLGFVEAPGSGNYTWVKYATSAAGAGMSDNPTGMTYIGFAFNKTTATKSTNPADYSWSKITGADGAAGSQAATAYLYRWSTTAPAAPTGTSTFTWATGANSTYTAADGWYVTVPANPGTPGIKLYVASVPVAGAAGTTGVTATYTGATVQAWSQNGSNGTNGSNGANAIQSASPTVYQWAASIPAGPVGSPTLTWSSGAFGAAPAGWTLTPGASPSPGMTLWAARVQVTDSAANATTGFNWSAAAVMAVGYAGSNGGTGAAGSSYVTAYCASATGSATSAPAATTGKTSLPAANSGGITGTWSSTVPALTAGQYLYQTDGIYNPTTNQVIWSIPYWSSLKVATLSAISANFGSMTAGSIDLGGGKIKLNNDGTAELLALTVKKPDGTVVMTSSGLTAAGAAPGTLNSEVIGRGSNLLSNSAPGSASGYTSYTNSGFAIEQGGPIFEPSAVYAPNRAAVFLHIVGSPPQNTTAELYCNQSRKANVVAGRRYEASVNISTFKCKAQVRLAWYDSGGQYITQDAGNEVINSQAGYYTVPFPRSTVFAIAPPGAVYAMVFVLQVHTGEADPYTFTSQWHFSEAIAGQTSPAPWAEGAPSSVRAIGFDGDLDATRGAPAGTLVGGTDAATVAANAAAVTTKLSKTSADSLAATVTIATGGSILSGTTTNGTYLSPSGLYGVQGGVVKFSVPISGDPTFAGQLTAAYGTFGAVSIASGGSFSSGQTAYNTGTGWWLGYSGATPVISIGVAGGQSLTWDGSNLIYSGKLGGVMALTITDAMVSSKSNTTIAAPCGSLAVNITNGRAPFKIQWSVGFISTSPDTGTAKVTLVNSETATIDVKIAATNDTSATAQYIATVIDADGKSASVSKVKSVQFGTPS